MYADLIPGTVRFRPDLDREKEEARKKAQEVHNEKVYMSDDPYHTHL